MFSCEDLSCLTGLSRGETITNLEKSLLKFAKTMLLVNYFLISTNFVDECDTSFSVIYNLVN